jgi:hypothetical protein
MKQESKDNSTSLQEGIPEGQAAVLMIGFFFPSWSAPNSTVSGMVSVQGAEC